ncbi:ParB/RepB/Spo0J family partition protein [bacterium]|nr:ParB/RepB/Spo0J family partition protein [bacterium]
MRKALGRGLEALIPSFTSEEEKKEVIVNIPLDKIKPNKYQPRFHFAEGKIKELADSIKEKGIVQPILVLAKEEGYELIAGERRWRASQIAGVKEIPALVKKMSEREIFEISLIENIQREDLNPLEEAEAYQRISKEFKLTQEELAKKLGKTRSSVANSVRLLNLPEKIKGFLSSGILSSGHARAILSLKEQKSQEDLAQRVATQKLSVRETEEIVQHYKPKKGKTKPGEEKTQNPEITNLEEKIQYALGTKVKIKNSGKKGKIEIFYYSLEDMERIIKLLKA